MIKHYCCFHPIPYRRYITLKANILTRLNQLVFEARLDCFYRSNVVRNARLAAQQGKPWVGVDYALMKRIYTLELCTERLTNLYLAHPARD